MYRIDYKDFTRSRGLPFSSLVYFLLQKGKSSLQYELDEYLQPQEGQYTKSAFSQHRRKLSHKIFEDLNTNLLSEYYDVHRDFKRWNGFRVIGIDGSTMQLPTSDELIKDFGIFETRTENNRKVVLARISQAFDVLNHLTIDAKIHHYRTSELSLAETHISALSENDLVLADRGYAAFWFLSKLQGQKLHFLIRLKEKRWKVAKDFLKSGKQEDQVIISPSNEAKKRCKERGVPHHSLKLRLIRVSIKDGDDYVLVTNLTDSSRWKAKELSDLYRLRWPTEESFKLLKVRAELENLSGKSTLTVKQDFYRIICRANLSRLLSKAITSVQVDYVNKHRKSHYKINATQAYRKTRDLILGIMRNTIYKWLSKLRSFGFALVNQLEIVRPDRKVPHHRRYGGRPANFMAYKP